MAQEYQREKDGIRFDIQGGMNTVAPTDAIQRGKYPFLQNVRRYLKGRIVGRTPLGSNVLSSALPAGVTSMTRLNDATPAGPPSGYVLISGAAGNMYVNATQVKSGLSGNPLSYMTSRPNASPQPWCWVGDPTGIWKVRSDGTVWKAGIAEPQTAPSVSFGGGGSGVVQILYRYVYRSSVTGAPSNPSPESIPGTNAQSSPFATVNASDYATKITFNSSQWEYVAPQLRTKGGVGPGITTDYVIAHNFGLSIPEGVNIDGIQIDLNWVGQNAGTGVLSAVALFYQGNQLGKAKFPGVQNQSYTIDTLQGGNSDQWGATLTPDILNDPSFGFGVQITTQMVGSTERSFLDYFTITVYYSTQNAVITPQPSSDPQVDKIDFYRFGGSLTDFTYVGTGPNAAVPFSDILSDLAAINNPILQFDNYEPFPSIDIPRRGTVNVATGAVQGTMDVTWVSGDQFNTRWLPGTVMVIGTVAYTLYNRPTDSTHLTVILTTTLPSPSTGLGYEIAQPILAAQPSPVIWGPTPENQGSFFFGLDPLNTGDLVWCKGNNFDAAPDTNRLNVTSPGEPLQNGTITSELSTVFSTERFWLIIPNFADAVATVTGVVGQQWGLIQSAATRGLYMRYAIAAQGSMIAYRAKDCIAISMGGGPEQSITEDIYNLFPHEGPIPGVYTTPQPVTIGDKTVYPPDDTKPNAQTITISVGYIYYNYQDINGTPRTLVYDIEGKGWSVDSYSPAVNCHLWQMGQVNQTLCGCVDGTIRAMANGGGEASTAIVMTRSENSGDSRALKRIGDVFIKALATNSNPFSIALWQSRLTVPLSGFSPTSLTGTGSLHSYIVDFVSGLGNDVDDIALEASWPVGSGNQLDLWQPDWTDLPEIIQDRPLDWDDCGVAGNKLIRGMSVEMDSLNAAKAIRVQRSDDLSIIAPAQASVTVNVQTIVPFTFTPFVGHMLRVISTDGVPWRYWGVKWIVDPWPEYTPLYSAWSNLGTDGAKYMRGVIVPMDTNGAPAQFRVVTSDGASVTFTANTPGAQKTPVSFAFTPPIVAHEVQIQCLSNAGIWSEEIQWIFDAYPEITPQYTAIMEIGGPDNKFVQGIKLTADTGNVPVTFQILYDGGQVGPTFTADFNGKQTKAFSWPPFMAHDIQLVPQSNARIWTDVSEWVYKPFPESVSDWESEMLSFGLKGWLHIPWINLSYAATTPVTLTLTFNTGGVITLTFPSTGGKQDKVFQTLPASSSVGSCKFKLVSFKVSSSAPFNIFQPDCEVAIKEWGSTGSYQIIRPFGGQNQPGAEL
jgi:hypothetical protein